MHRSPWRKKILRCESQTDIVWNRSDKVERYFELVVSDHETKMQQKAFTVGQEAVRKALEAVAKNDTPETQAALAKAREMEAGAYDTMTRNGFFNISAQQVETILYAWRTPNVLAEFALAGGKSTVVAHILIKADAELSGRLGFHVTADNQAEAAFNDIAHTYADGEVVLWNKGATNDMGKMLAELKGKDGVKLKSIVMDPEVPQAVLNIIKRGSVAETPERVAQAREILAAMRENTRIIFDEAHMTLNPGSRLISSSGGVAASDAVKEPAETAFSIMKSQSLLSFSPDSIDRFVTKDGKQVESPHLTEEGYRKLAAGIKEQLDLPDSVFVDAVLTLLKASTAEPKLLADIVAGRHPSETKLTQTQVEKALDILDAANRITSQYGRAKPGENALVQTDFMKREAIAESFAESRLRDKSLSDDAYKKQKAILKQAVDELLVRAQAEGKDLSYTDLVNRLATDSVTSNTITRVELESMIRDLKERANATLASSACPGGPSALRCARRGGV